MACAFLDGVSTAAGMAQSSKEILASRLLIKFCACTELLALSTISYSLSRILSMEKFENLEIAWCGILAPGRTVPVLTLLYMLLRYLTAIHNIWLGLHFKDIFDIVEKIDKGWIAPLSQKSQVALQQTLVTSPAASEEGTNTTFVYPMSNVYNKLPATAFTKYSQYLLVLVSSTTSIEVFLSETRQSASFGSSNAYLY